ncbi:hypothetical protein HHK36_027367 [Tetracentron sinense]|uniref:RING-type domain-containing protein n=1 Tax=Tetracentron sinense TaxID=13715 RepID=A0A835D176_TETSI|nr:hypothetical protein HHK36_027367 [Tetracentron sinense]
MGFPSGSIKMPQPIVITDLLHLLGHVKFMVMVAMSHLGLFDSPDQAPSLEHQVHSIPAGLPPSPLLVPLPVHIISESIKKRLPVVEFSDFLEASGSDEEENAVCAVCLSCLERSHEMRELPNCSHMFHKNCLDSWVDQGQLTCPLCRSMLFPAQEDQETREGGDPFMAERIAYLFGEDYVMDTTTFKLMELPCVGTRMPKPRTGLLGHVKCMVLETLFRLHLFVLPNRNFDHVLTDQDCPSPSLVPVPVHIGSDSIKKMLPVIEYSRILERYEICEDEELVCVVCLDCLERRHEIRELSNCSHVFHRECLDKWVDQGQVACPLCRSKLLPTQGEEIKDPWMLERIAYLFGEETLISHPL